MRDAPALPARVRVVLLALLLAAFGLYLEGPAPAQAATTATFVASADAEVSSTAPNSNYGSDVKMAVCQACAVAGAPTKRDYVAFQVTGLTGPVTAATLRVRALTSNVPAFSVQQVAAGWSESALTWSNAPAPGATLGSSPGGPATGWYQVQLAAGTVTGDGSYAFAVTSASSTVLRLSTKEATTPYPAELVVQTDTGGATDPVVTAAGDISPQVLNGTQVGTSDRVLAINPTVALTLGDNQYPDGSLAQYNTYYQPTWGRFKDRTRPVPGNHEYRTAGAAGYFDYYGSLARPSGRSYYSFDLGDWHLVALDSNIELGSGTPQAQWLQADLAATTRHCVLAYWHHPRFTSGTHHDDTAAVAPWWDLLYAARADLVLNGHEHNYERFARQDPQRRADAAGIREFVVGTGGVALNQDFGPPDANSEVRIDSSYGVLQLTLHPGSYEWRLVSPSGQVLDAGGPDACH